MHKDGFLKAPPPEDPPTTESEETTRTGAVGAAEPGESGRERGFFPLVKLFTMTKAVHETTLCTKRSTPAQGTNKRFIVTLVAQLTRGYDAACYTIWLPSVLSVYFASIRRETASSLLLFQRYSDAMLVVARHLLYADFFSGCLKDGTEGAEGGLSQNRAKSDIRFIHMVRGSPR